MNNRRGFSRVALEILAVSVLALCSAAAQQNQGNSLPPGVEIRAQAIPPKATIGDLIHIDFDVALPPGCQARIPKPGSTAGDFSIIDFVPGPQIPGTDRPPQPDHHYRARITAAVYKTGTFVFPPLPILLRTDKGNEMEVLSPSVRVEIRSVLTGADRNLKDLKKQADIKEPVRWLLWIAALLAVCLIAFIAWRIWRRRRSRPSMPAAPGRDPLEEAAAELRALLSRGLPEKGREKVFYIALSEIVKKIIGIGYRIHTAEQTTWEIMSKLRRGNGPDPENLEPIESFLIRCDMVKFAKYVPSEIEQKTARDDALGILKAVASRQSSVVSEKEASALSNPPLATGD